MKAAPPSPKASLLSTRRNRSRSSKRGGSGVRKKLQSDSNGESIPVGASIAMSASDPVDDNSDASTTTSSSSSSEEEGNSDFLMTLRASNNWREMEQEIDDDADNDDDNEKRQDEAPKPMSIAASCRKCADYDEQMMLQQGYRSQLDDALKTVDSLELSLRARKRELEVLRRHVAFLEGAIADSKLIKEHDTLEDGSLVFRSVHYVGADKMPTFVVPPPEAPYDRTYVPSHAVWLAHCAALAYASPVCASAVVSGLWRWPELRFFDDAGTDTHALGMLSESYAVVAFRGTESKENWSTNLDYKPKRVANFEGMHLRDDLDDLERWLSEIRVHSGFETALASVWPQLAEFCARVHAARVPLYVCGHSLGGALATVFYLLLSIADSERSALPPCAGVYTFGQPRVGNAPMREFLAREGARLQRIRNRGDAVPSVPPSKPHGYKHAGDELFIDADGLLVQRASAWKRQRVILSRVAATAGRSSVGDHAQSNYVDSVKGHYEFVREMRKANQGVQYVGRMHKAIVIVHRASDLYAADINGCSDPYVTLSSGVGSIAARTSTKYKTLEPVYEEELHCTDLFLGDVLWFKVYDYDSSSADDFLGGASITLHSFKPLVNVELPLVGRANHKDRHVRGSLYVSIAFVDLEHSLRNDHVFGVPIYEMLEHAPSQACERGDDNENGNDSDGLHRHHRRRRGGGDDGGDSDSSDSDDSDDGEGEAYDADFDVASMRSSSLGTPLHSENVPTFVSSLYQYLMHYGLAGRARSEPDAVELDSLCEQLQTGNFSFFASVPAEAEMHARGSLALRVFVEWLDALRTPICRFQLYDDWLRVGDVKAGRQRLAFVRGLVARMRSWQRDTLQVVLAIARAMLHSSFLTLVSLEGSIALLGRKLFFVRHPTTNEIAHVADDGPKIEATTRYLIEHFVLIFKRKSTLRVITPARYRLLSAPVLPFRARWLLYFAVSSRHSISNSVSAIVHSAASPGSPHRWVICGDSRGHLAVFDCSSAVHLHTGSLFSDELDQGKGDADADDEQLSAADKSSVSETYTACSVIVPVPRAFCCIAGGRVFFVNKSRAASRVPLEFDGIDSAKARFNCGVRIGTSAWLHVATATHASDVTSDIVVDDAAQGAIIVFDAANRFEERRIAPCSPTIAQLVDVPSERQVWAADVGGDIHVYSPESLELVATLKSPGGDAIASSSSSSPSTSSLLSKAPTPVHKHDAPRAMLVVAATNTVWVAVEQQIFVWSVPSRTLVNVIACHHAIVSLAAFDHYVVAGGEFVDFYDAASFELLSRIDSFLDPPHRVAAVRSSIHAPTWQLWIASNNGLVSLWSLTLCAKKKKHRHRRSRRRSKSTKSQITK
jgi:triacylglycerol lipase